METSKLQIEEYSELLETGLDMKCIYYEKIGSYQGRYVAVLYDEGETDLHKRLFVYIGYFGSCSGCDYIESRKDDNYTIDYREVLEYLQDIKPLCIFPIGIDKNIIVDYIDKFMIDIYEDNINTKQLLYSIKQIQDEQKSTTD